MSLDEPANGKQRRYIALLCMRLGIRQPLEEQSMTRGEAGVRIQDLKKQARKEVITDGYKCRHYGQESRGG